MTTLPAAYAALTAKRSELAVERLHYLRSADQWFRESKITGTHRSISSDEAEAMIESHLLRTLPKFYVLNRTGDIEWRVSNEDGRFWPGARLPIEALIAFHMEDRK